MGIGFKGGFTAFMDGWNKAEDRNRTQKRQDEEDAWMKRERDRKIADQEREDKLRDELAEAAKDKTEKIDNFVMAPVDGAVPPVEMTRPQTEEELLRSTEQVYRRAGKVPEAIKYGSAAKQLGMDDYATKFGQWRAAAGELPVKDQVAQAIQIFNDSPNPGTIGNVRYDEKGSVTFDAYNKVTGQKVTKTFADPKKLVDDLHAYYSSGSWNKEQEQRVAEAKAAALEADKPRVMSPGQQLVKGGKAVYTVPDRMRAGGMGGSGGGGGGREPGPQQAPSFDVNKVALDRWKDLTKAQEDVNFSGVKQTPQALQKQAMAEALSMRSNVYDNFKREQQDGIIHQLMAPARNSAMDVGSKEYADLYQRLQQAKGQAIPRQYLESIGYPYPTLWERPARSGPVSQK